MVKNYVEYIVDELLEDLLHDSSQSYFVCTCQECLDSIKARTLNKISPFYITSLTGVVYGTYRNLEVQNKTDIVAQVMHSIEVVGKKPGHPLPKKEEATK